MKNFSDAQFEAALQESAKIRPCGLNVSDYVVSDINADQSVSKFLTADFKALWAQSYWALKGMDASIECDDVTVQEFGSRGLVVAKCRIIVDGTVIASAAAGRSFPIPGALPNANPAEEALTMDSAIQSAASVALGRALSNAGFAPVWRTSTPGEYFGPEQPDNKLSPAPAQPAPMEGYIELPFTMGGNPPPAPVQPAPVNGNAPRVNAPTPMTMEQAKTVKYPFRGRNQGKSLGEVLATDPKSIIYLAEKGQDEFSRNAAAMLLPQAKQMCGMA